MTTPQVPLLPRPRPHGLQLILRPLVEFLHTEAAGGIVLLVATVAALIWVNSPWAEAYQHLWHTTVGVEVGRWSLKHPLEWWINDGLMVLFFFVVGLEIKRELVAGELREPRKAALPAAAALGGMLVPALVYFALQHGRPGERGWGVPMATDIAFAIGVLALLPRVPAGLKILLLSLAIVDDIGAVLVIGIFYSSDISFVALAWAGGGLLAIVGARLARIRVLGLYAAIAVFVWLALTQSGIHPTLAGVALGLLTPSRSLVGKSRLLEILEVVSVRLRAREDDSLAEEVNTLVKYGRRTMPLLDRLQSALHPWVAFAIMPLFALANAGVVIDMRELASPVSLAVAAGLLLGKPIGVVLFSLAAVRLGVAQMPTGVTFGRLCGIGFLAGIGFTMSLFIAALGLKGDLLTAGKVGTLIGSVGSAALGVVVLMLTLPRRDAGD